MATINRKEHSQKMEDKNFKNPPKEYRPISFWSLNGQLERGELIKQIDGFKETGWGGYFLHARSGLKTPYMSDEWLDRLEDSIDRKSVV